MNINYDLLKQVCLSPIKTFESLGEVTDTKDGIYIYKDNPKAKILGIAHLDTVLSDNHFYHVKIKGDSIILNSQLDDRLGVYTLLDILPRMGIQFDLLLTEGEEQGRSTAAYFESQKDYNWMFSFDRHGDDVVMYQYDDAGLRTDLKRSGFIPGHGSFSDIAFLDHLGIRGINVGTGYEGEHSSMSYANMSVWKKQVLCFKQFYDLFEDKKYNYVPAPTSAKAYPALMSFRGGREWTDYYDDFYCYLCNKHQGKHQIINDVWLCDACFNDAGQCAICEDIVYADELMDGHCMNCQDDMQPFK